MLMWFYAVTFGGFVGLASFLTIYFNDQYGLSPATSGLCTAIIVFIGSFVRPLGGALADRIGGIKALIILLAAACGCYAAIGFGLPSLPAALAAFCMGMMALGLGNGAVFQLVPTRFPQSVGILTGIVGMSGGVGGFCLPVLLGTVRHATGGYGAGFLFFAALAGLAMASAVSARKHWNAEPSGSPA